jgi:RNA polymerase sigma factor (sigma-70 family)
MLGNALPSLLQHVRRLAATASSDEQLLADYLARRSDDAFSALIGRHGPMVLSVSRRILHDAHAAEDVFQATFLVLADRAGAIRCRTSLAGFLHGVAYRLAVRAAKKRTGPLNGRGRVPFVAGVCDKAAGPVEELAWKEVLGILDHELDQLSDRHRAPLVLCYLEGRTQDEAARQLGWSVSTLRRRLAEGRRLLEVRLRGRGVTLPAALAGVLAAGAGAVPGHLRAATLAAAAARAAVGLNATASVLSSAWKAISPFFFPLGKKLGALVAVAALGVAVCLACCWTPHADQAPVAEEGARGEGRRTREEEQVASLVPHPSPLASFAGADPLPAQGAVRLGTARYRHGTQIENLAVSADGKLAVTASGNSPYSSALAGRFSPARVFDLESGRCLYSLPNERGAYRECPEAVDLSPDGKTLAVRDDKYLYFCDAATGKELRKLNYMTPAGGSRSPTGWIAFTPDGKQVAVTLLGHAVQLVDVATCKVIRTFAPDAAARACVFSPDGKLMAAGGYEQKNGVYYARLWEVTTGNELRRFAVAHKLNQPIGALALSQDGTKLAGAAWGDGRLRLFEVATGRQLHAFPKIAADIRSSAFAPDGKTIAAASDNIYLYDPDTGKERLRIERRAQQLIFSRDGSVLIGAVSGAIYRWDAASGRQLTPAAGQDSAVEQIFVSADGRSLFTTDQDGDLYRWDTAGKKPPRRIAGGINRGIVASPDRRLLAWTVQGADGNSRIRLYDVVAQRLIDPALRSSEGFSVIGGAATVTAFLPDSKTLLTFEARPATFRLWDIESGKERRSFEAIPPKTVAVPRGAAPADDFDLPVRLWDVATGKAGPALKLPMNVLGVPDDAGGGTVSYLGHGPRPFCTTRRAALSPDGKTVAISRDWAQTFGNRQMKPMDGRAFSPDGRFLVDWAENPLGRSRMDHVYVWDTATGRAVATLADGPRPGATNAAFAPDGRTLATASADGVVRLWETATWSVRAEFRGHRDRVTAVAFGPDGRLFTGGLDTVVLGWDVRPPRGPAKGTLADAWDALASADARSGFQAQGRFLAEPGKAVEWLTARLTPAAAPDPSHVKALIADLEKDDFATRARATAALKESWPATAAVLRALAANGSSLEARRRAEGIIREMESAVRPAGERRAVRATEVLEWIATREARALLLELAKGAPDFPLTSEAAAACKRLGARR